MPSGVGSYITLIARVCPGLFTERHIRYFLPQEQGWDFILQWQIEQGFETIWPDERDEDVRWWNHLARRWGR